MQTTSFEKEEETYIPAGILANRPLTHFAKMNNGDCPTCIRPATKKDIFKGDLEPAPITNSPTTTIAFQPSSEDASMLDAISIGGDYFLLDHEKEHRTMIQKNKETNNQKQQDNMELATQLYMGGLTILGLFFLYRMMTQKKL